MYWGEKKPSKKVIQAKDPNKIIPPSLKEYYFFKNEIDIEQDIGLIVKPENQNSGFNNDQDLIKELLENKAINSDNNLLKEEISSLFSEKKQ